MIESEIIHRGKCFTISGIAVSGKCLTRIFIDGLDVAQQIQVAYLLKRSADSGPPKNKEKFRHLKGKIYEFKSDQVRLLCFFERDKLIILTHGFIKKKDKTPKTEIEKAESLMEQYQSWRKKK